MFIFCNISHALILLLYVVDIILADSSSYILQSFISVLSQQFAMKDLRELHYFLGI